ncbi:substrate-binding domain-containing protein [Ornithinimicrobium sp. Y1694]|uniref:substrate-binding domain-containing protein n=1 Tax=Ornithinimicrobium sp. Y1694 TaxID=3418590 RepID=UPI003CE68037
MQTLFRRTSIIALAGALALGTTACNRGTDSPGTDEGGETGGATGGGETLTLAVSTLNNPFFIDLRDGAQEAADEAGVNLEVVDAQNDAATQQNQLDNAATQGVDAILINPVDSEAAAAAVAPALDADIPVIAVDRSVEGAEVNSTVSSDNVAGGRQAAEALAEAMGGEGKVIVLQGVAGTSASRDRGQGFEEGIAEFDGIEVVAMQPANFDRTQGLDVATNLLESHPDVTGIFAENDEMALGALQALGDRAGSDVFVVGFDGTDDALTAIDEGRMVATIAQQPSELGKVAVELALQAINGDDLPEAQPVDVVTVTSENVADFQ